MTQAFYRAFEDKFRGSRELIKQRLRVYLPFIDPLRLHNKEVSAIDLGCGRGEWLEILSENGITGLGVDINESMLSDCRSRGLKVYTADALSFLQDQPDNSQAIISGFHIVEHLPFATLQAIVSESKRILVPGGLLILETPNPENIITGSSSFYLDPTHVRPLPPGLLLFALEHEGFARVKVIRLQEQEVLHREEEPLTLLNVLNGVSPDYSIVAQKSGPEKMLRSFNIPFEREYGITLEDLANRYQTQFDVRFHAAASKADQLSLQLEKLQSDISQHARQLESIYTSKSWQFTAPLRATFEIIRRVKRFFSRHISMPAHDVHSEEMGLFSPVPVKDPGRPCILLDTYVLAQGTKTGVYRVCEEIFPRLAQREDIEVRFLIRSGFLRKSLEFLESHNLTNLIVSEHTKNRSNVCDILLSPFGVAPKAWLDDASIKHAHIVYDLIGVHHPHFFSTLAANEVVSIMNSLSPKTLIFAISNHTKSDLLIHRNDLSPDQIVVAPLAAGPKFYPESSLENIEAVKIRYQIPPKAPYILSLATLEIRKNLDSVVEAFKLHHSLYPHSDLHLVLAGMSGWKLEALEKSLLSAKALRSKIILTGFVADEDLSPLYSGALCFIYLSRYEGFGLPPLEAMACGTPVICSNNSSLPEVIGESGILIDSNNIEAAAESIGAIFNSAPLRERMKADGLAQSSRFSWESCSDIIADALKKHASTRETPL